MEHGALCRGCSPGRCDDAPSATQPAIFKCPLCDGRGCGACDQAGTFELDHCPTLYLDESVRSLVNTYGPLFDLGAMPVAGGVLDQCASFIAAHSFLRIERDRWKAKITQKR